MSMRLWIVAAALAVLTVTVYAPVRRHAFINFDDPQYVSQNAHVTSGLTVDNVRWAFTAGYAGNWHPVTWISHMLDVHWFGLDPGAHHVMNVALHVTSTLLLLWVLWRMTGAAWPSVTVAALFALHPLHVESVAWIAERKDVLSGLFWMLTLAAYVSFVEDRRLWRYAIVVGCYALALMSKPMVVTLPFVLLLLDVWPLRRFNRNAVLEKLPLIALSLAVSVITFMVQREAGAVKALDVLPVTYRVENAIVAYGRYVLMTVWPSGLAPIYPYRTSIPMLEVAASVTTVLGITIVAVRQARVRPYLLVGWLMFVGMLVPVIGLVQAGSQPFADRYTYLPSIGLFIMIVWASADLAARWVRSPTVVLAVIASTAVITCAWLARTQVGYWTDSVTLWRHAVNVTRGNYRAHSNLGQALYTAGRNDDAMIEYRNALAVKPDFAEAANYLGMSLQDRGDIDGAIAQFRVALDALPSFPTAHNNLGLALATEGRFEEAAAEFQEAARLNPQLTAARTNLGIALVRLERFDEAVAAFGDALTLEPDSAQARMNLATARRDRAAARLDAGRTDDALTDLRAAVETLPNDAEVYYLTGVALAKKGLAADAVRALGVAVQIDPAHEAAKRLLAALRK
jgi:Flp pilus assembly protein TadD